MSLILLSDVQGDLSALLGEQSTPAESNADYAVRTTFIKRSLERIYRIYDFELGQTTATMTLTSGIGTLPTDARGTGPELDIRVVNAGSNADLVFEHISYGDQDDYSQGEYKYWLTKNTSGNWQVNTTETTIPAVTVRYTPMAPTINNSVGTPFPSSMTVALGALVYYRQAENPEADIAPEEDQFQLNLREVIAAERRNQPQRRFKTRLEASGHYTGEVLGE